MKKNPFKRFSVDDVIKIHRKKREDLIKRAGGLLGGLLSRQVPKKPQKRELDFKKYPSLRK
jgi:hypothetical protein